MITTDYSHPIIEISRLTTAIGENIIHKDLNLTVYEHEILAIVGGSGSGKTMLLRAILMLQPILSGSIKIFDNEIVNCSPTIEKEIQRSWGVLFQHSALFSSLTVLENIAFQLQEQTNLDRNTINEIAKLKLALVGLSLKDANKYPSQLSGGMQKRAALARAIALDPRLLLLDEPSAGLDPQSATALDELLLSLKENLGLTLIVVTHDVDTLWRVSDRVAFLGDKKVLQVDPMEKLVESKQKLIHDYFSDPRAKAARQIKDIVGS